MHEQENLRIVSRGYDAFNQGDIQTLLGLFDEQIQWVSPGPPELPTSGRRRGLQQVAEFFRTVDNLFEFQAFEPQTFLADGDRVVVLGVERVRIKATGKVIDGEWAHVFTVRNGKVAAFHEYVDTAAIVAELKAAQASA